MRKWIEKILPGYSVLPLILAVSINMLVYFGTSQLRDYLTFHTITTALDEWIPFVAPFIPVSYTHLVSDGGDNASGTAVFVPGAGNRHGELPNGIGRGI